MRISNGDFGVGRLLGGPELRRRRRTFIGCDGGQLGVAATKQALDAGEESFTRIRPRVALDLWKHPFEELSIQAPAPGRGLVNDNEKSIPDLAQLPAYRDL